jgi:hypothetical protein
MFQNSISRIFSHSEWLWLHQSCWKFQTKHVTKYAESPNKKKKSCWHRDHFLGLKKNNNSYCTYCWYSFGRFAPACYKPCHKRTWTFLLDERNILLFRVVDPDGLQSGSSIFAQSRSGYGSTKSMNPNLKQTWIHAKTLEDNFFY